MMGLKAANDLLDLAPNDSYLVDSYADWMRYFTVLGRKIQWILDKELDYSDEAVQQSIESLVTDIRNDECFVNDSAYTSSWIHDFTAFLETNHSGDVNQT